MKVSVLIVALLVSCVIAQSDPNLPSTVVQTINQVRTGGQLYPVPVTPLQPVSWDTTLAAAAAKAKCGVHVPQFKQLLYGDNFITLDQDMTGYADSDIFNYYFQTWTDLASDVLFYPTKTSCYADDCTPFLQLVATTSTTVGCAVNHACGSYGELRCLFRKFASGVGSLPYKFSTTPSSNNGNNVNTVNTVSTISGGNGGNGNNGGNGGNGGNSIGNTGGWTVTTGQVGTTGKPSSTTGRPNTPTGKPSTSGKPTAAPNGQYASIDWRKTNRVNPDVTDQGQCGCCWAFSATTVVEGAIGSQTSSFKYALSQQDVIDCTFSNYNQACNGGVPSEALSDIYSKLGGGLPLATAWPYQDINGPNSQTTDNNGVSLKGCPKGLSNPATFSQQPATIDGTQQGNNNLFDQMYQALKTHGPVGIAIDASDDSFNNYSGDVYSYSGTSIDHAVTVVGYDASQNAWIVRNSWGPSWGMSGYFLLNAVHGQDAGANLQGGWYIPA